jgi:hypothetical protein
MMGTTDFSVVSIDASKTKDWILNKHYAKRMPVINYAFGLFDKSGVLHGVCTFGRPASRPLCVGICGKEYAENVIELNRLCVNDGAPENTTSYFVSKCLKSLPDNTIVVSFADTEQGHIGVIYQATNFIYTGLSDAHKEWRIIGRNTHSKNVCKAYTLDERKEKNGTVFEQVDRPQKHRYIYFVGNKTFKKKMLSKLKYSIEPYPKGETKRYDASYQPVSQMMLTNFLG